MGTAGVPEDGNLTSTDHLDWHVARPVADRNRTEGPSVSLSLFLSLSVCLSLLPLSPFPCVCMCTLHAYLVALTPLGCMSSGKGQDIASIYTHTQNLTAPGQHIL